MVEAFIAEENRKEQNAKSIFPIMALPSTARSEKQQKAVVDYLKSSFPVIDHMDIDLIEAIIPKFTAHNYNSDVVVLEN